MTHPTLSAARQMADNHSRPATWEPSPGFDLNLAEAALDEAERLLLVVPSKLKSGREAVARARQSYLTDIDAGIIKEVLDAAIQEVIDSAGEAA